MFNRTRAKHVPVEFANTEPPTPKTRLIMSPSSAYVSQYNQLTVEGSVHDWNTKVSDALANPRMIEYKENEYINPFHVHILQDATE